MFCVCKYIKSCFIMHKKSATSALLNYVEQFNIVIILLNLFRNEPLVSTDLQ